MAAKYQAQMCFVLFLQTFSHQAGLPGSYFTDKLIVKVKPCHSCHQKTLFPLEGINNSKGSSMNINELDISLMPKKDQKFCIDRVQLPQDCQATMQQSVNIRCENGVNNSMAIKINIKAIKRTTCLRLNRMSQL